MSIFTLAQRQHLEGAARGITFSMGGGSQRVSNDDTDAEEDPRDPKVYVKGKKKKVRPLTVPGYIQGRFRE